MKKGDCLDQHGDLRLLLHIQHMVVLDLDLGARASLALVQIGDWLFGILAGGVQSFYCWSKFSLLYLLIERRSGKQLIRILSPWD